MTKENLQASILDLNSRLESERMAPFFKIIFFYDRYEADEVAEA